MMRHEKVLAIIFGVKGREWSRIMEQRDDMCLTRDRKPGCLYGGASMTIAMNVDLSARFLDVPSRVAGDHSVIV